MATASRKHLDLAVECVPGEAKFSVVGDPYVASFIEVSLKFLNEAIFRNWFVRHGPLGLCVRQAPKCQELAIQPPDGAGKREHEDGLAGAHDGRGGVDVVKVQRHLGCSSFGGN